MSLKSRLLLILLALWAGGCIFHNKTTYDLPVYLTGDQKKAALEKLDKGKKLYRLHCAGCHGIFAKGKDGIPNFTARQIDNYNAWTIRRDPRSHAVAAKMSTDQLDEVFIFLKKRHVD